MRCSNIGPRGARNWFSVLDSPRQLLSPTVREDKMKRILVILTIFALVGCTSSRGFDRGGLTQGLYVDQGLKEPNVQVTDEDIKQALERKPQLSFPMKLGVYLKNEWQWRGQDKDVVMGWGNQLKAQGIVEEFFIISDLALSQTDHMADLKVIKIAAAHHGAVAVLV